MPPESSSLLSAVLTCTCCCVADDPSASSSRLLCGLAAFAGMGGFLFGYDIGVISGALPLLANDTELALDDRSTELIVGQAKIGAALGAFGATWVLQSRGHVALFWLSGLAFIAGPILIAAAAPSPLLVGAGRLLTGLGVGLSAVASPTYLADIAPLRSRGCIVGVYELMLTLGVVTAAVVDTLLQLPAVVSWVHAHLSVEPWRLALGLPGLPAIPYFLGSLLLPETPATLAAQVTGPPNCSPPEDRPLSVACACLSRGEPRTPRRARLSHVCHCGHSLSCTRRGSSRRHSSCCAACTARPQAA